MFQPPVQRVELAVFRRVERVRQLAAFQWEEGLPPLVEGRLRVLVQLLAQPVRLP